MKKVDRKDQLVAEYISARNELISAASSIPGERQDSVFLGQWTVKDLLAHLIGWDYSNIEAFEAIAASRLPNFYKYYDRDWRAYNAQLVSRYGCDDSDELLSALEQSQGAVLEVLAGISTDEFTRDSGIRFKGYRVTMANILKAELKDEREHAEQIRKFANQ